MKSIYQSPLIGISEIKAESVLCASGDNENFGFKNGSFDLLNPANAFPQKF